MTQPREGRPHRQVSPFGACEVTVRATRGRPSRDTTPTEGWDSSYHVGRVVASYTPRPSGVTWVTDLTGTSMTRLPGNHIKVGLSSLGGDSVPVSEGDFFSLKEEVARPMVPTKDPSPWLSVCQKVLTDWRRDPFSGYVSWTGNCKTKVKSRPTQEVPTVIRQGRWRYFTWGVVSRPLGIIKGRV